MSLYNGFRFINLSDKHKNWQVLRQTKGNKNVAYNLECKHTQKYTEN